MPGELARDYALSASDAQEVRGLVLMPADVRRLLLDKYLATEGSDRLIELFTQFIGRANAVVANNREMIELYALTELGHSERQAERINLPDLYGAANGAILAASITAAGRCHGCALRIGSVANQSAPTIADLASCLDGTTAEPFLCHEQDDPTIPTARTCAGFRQAVQLQAAQGGFRAAHS